MTKKTSRREAKKNAFIPNDFIVIERVLTDSDGHITALDIHDERFGDAIFLEATNSHFHGFYGTPKEKARLHKALNKKQK